LVGLIRLIQMKQNAREHIAFAPHTHVESSGGLKHWQLLLVHLLIDVVESL
jgi:hypothetical protein